MGCKMRDAARQYFKDAGIEYSAITKHDIEALIKLLRMSLAKYLIEGGDHALQMDMRVAKLLKQDIQFTKYGLKYAQIEIDGSYFERRECISFNRNGFIGFGSEFSDRNIKPILDAFYQWCDLVKKKARGEDEAIFKSGLERTQG